MSNWIEKQRSILDFTLSSLMRRKAKNFSLFLVYSLVVFVLGSAMFFTQAMKREASLILKEAPEMVIQRILCGRYEPIPLDYLDRIGKIRGVISADIRLASTPGSTFSASSLAAAIFFDSAMASLANSLNESGKIGRVSMNGTIVSRTLSAIST